MKLQRKTKGSHGQGVVGMLRVRGQLDLGSEIIRDVCRALGEASTSGGFEEVSAGAEIRTQGDSCRKCGRADGSGLCQDSGLWKAAAGRQGLREGFCLVWRQIPGTVSFRPR